MNELALPKPPRRIKDKATLERFAAVRRHCQMCGVTSNLHIHHMGDLDREGIHRRSDVFENLMRLCADCHVQKFHSMAAWSKEQLRAAKERDESMFRRRYEAAECSYDGEAKWARGWGA